MKNFCRLTVMVGVVLFSSACVESPLQSYTSRAASVKSTINSPISELILINTTDSMNERRDFAVFFGHDTPLDGRDTEYLLIAYPAVHRSDYQTLSTADCNLSDAGILFYRDALQLNRVLDIIIADLEKDITEEGGFFAGLNATFDSNSITTSNSSTNYLSTNNFAMQYIRVDARYSMRLILGTHHESCGLDFFNSRESVEDFRKQISAGLARFKVKN